MIRLMVTAGAVACVVAVGACNEGRLETGAPLAGGAIAVAPLRNAVGASVGRAVATEVSGGLRVTVDGRDMPPGTRGAHIHTAGRCDAPGFETAGPHWNPTNAKHGTMNPQGPHRGDFPNLIVDSGGRGTVGVIIPGATMASLMDADGASFVIHAEPDDLKTDPSGNSGGRIACGVFQLS